MRVAVMGSGGLGGFFGGLLARAGEDVTFIARGAHLEAIRARGLAVRSPLVGDFTVHAPATANPGEIGPVDLVLVGVKTYDLDAAAVQLRPLVGPETLVLPLQNGIDSHERLAQVLGREPVLGGVGYVVSTIDAPGVIAHTGLNRVVFGELDGGASPRTERLQVVLTRAGIEAELHPDIRLPLWEKFVLLSATGGAMALTRLPLGTIRAHPETAALLRDTMAEAFAVGRACGVGLPDDCVGRHWAMLEGLPAGARGSMSHDLAAGRRLELDALTGTVVRLGHEHRVPTPLNRAVYAALKPFADGPPVL